MTASARSQEARANARRAARWVVVSAAVSVAAVGAAALLPAGAWRGAAAALAVVAVVAAVLLGRAQVQRPLEAMLTTQEREAVAAYAEQVRAERLASAGRLVATLLHELGNPLAAIVNYAHSLESKAPPELHGTIQSLQREAFRIERLRDGFLDFVRPRGADGGGADLAAAVKETLSFLSDQGALKKIQVDLHVPEKPTPTRGTSLELEQAIANLVLNAADAMPEGGRLVIWAERLTRLALLDADRRRTDADKGQIVYPRRRDTRLERWLETLDVEEVVKIIVADSGHGFLSADVEKIFEPFFTTKDADEGHGLGLTVVRRVVDSMEGIVWAQRSREGGAAFHIVLPVHPAASTA